MSEHKITDLVVRLRAPGRLASKQEAADEIERLRWLVREALDTFSTDPNTAPLGWIDRAEEVLAK